MTHQLKRCKHCLTVYSYQGSGEGCFHKDNNHTYCPDCMSAINETLSKIKPKFEDTWMVTEEVSVDRLKQWESDRINEHQMKMESGEVFLPLAKRIFVGLSNMKTGERDIINHVMGRDEFVGREFIYKYWSSAPDLVSVTTRVEKNLVTGETTPWKDYRN